MEKILPLDLTVLEKFTFVNGTGDYAHKQVCAMTALNLVTKIAKGEITLAEAITPAKDSWGDKTSSVEASDRVECVSPQLNELVINRNDATFRNKDRKEWAMGILPRIVGTNLGFKFERKIEGLVAEIEEEQKLKQLKELAQKFIDTGDTDHLEDAYNLHEDGNDEVDGDITILDAKIEAVIAFVEKEKAKRATRNAARRRG